MKLSIYFILILSILSFTNLGAQSVGINSSGSSPDNSAMLDVQSTSKGILIPRMTTGERTTISNPADGLLVFDTNSGSFWYFQSNGWIEIRSDKNAIFQKTANVVSPVNGYGTDDFVFGRSTLPLPGNTLDTFFFFNHDKAAFRGGYLSNKDSWQPTNIGTASFAYGRNAEASGTYSIALGLGSLASGTASFATGNDAEATGEYSTAFGQFVGANGDHSFAVGYETYASGDYSIAFGEESFADGGSAVAIGHSNFAEGSKSLAMGLLSSATGEESSSIGKGTRAQGNQSTAFGMYNDPLVATSTTMTATSPLLTIGNGDNNSSRSNAMVILKNGNTGIGIDAPQEKLEVDGALVLGTSSATSPAAGTIRYLAGTYEGYNGSTWNAFSNTDNQTISINNNQLSISNGNTIALPNSSSGDEVVDADGDTKIEVEQNPDEDMIRFSLEGEERLKLFKGNTERTRLELTNNYGNILIGENTGESLSNTAAVGNDNIFIGSDAGAATTNGSSNVFIGDESGKANTFGAFNTYLGDQTGLFKQTGNSNVFLGFGAGENNTSGSGNVFLGRQVSIPSGASNKLAIHNGPSNEETEALVYGEFDNGLLRINGQLEINEAYRFPTTNGQPNQALITNATGDLEWADIAGSTNSAGLPPPSTVYTTPATEFSNGPSGTFGRAVAIHGSFSCIGAPTEAIISDNVGLGQAYLYKQDAYGWYQEDLFTPLQDDTRNFGIAMDMDDNNIIVGSDIGINPFRGRIFYHSYTPSGDVTQLDIAQSSNMEDLDRFGSAVALSGDYIAVGAYAANGNQGRAYVFRFNGTSLVEEEILSETGTGRYGYSVDIEGDYLAIGAPHTGSLAGKAYIYTRSGTNWSLQQTVNSFGGETGHSVALSGNKLAVSATPVNGSQSVRIYERIGTTWTLEGTVTAIDSRDTDSFGSSISMDGNKLVVGAAKVDNNGANTGAVYTYLFDGTSWEFQKKHIAPNAESGDQIGASIKISGNKFIAGGSGTNTKVFIAEF